MRSGAIIRGVSEQRGAAYEIVTFDCYGTLVDWDAGIAAAFVDAARADGLSLAREAVLAAYHVVEPQVEGGPFRTYREVLGECAVRVAARLGWTLDAGRAGFLAESVADWLPFPDTNPALQRLANAGYRLGILSNVDDDILAGTRRHFAVAFEIVVTAQQVRSYKPASGHFLEARTRIGGRPWLHAAQSYYHDVVPARMLGVPVAWVNRKREQPAGEVRPDYEVFSMAALADLLT